MARLLFGCSQNRLRSPTAERVFSTYSGIEVLSAGTEADAETPLSGDLIQWADVILVMEKTHRNRINRKFRELLRGKRLVVLGIPDQFEYMQPELIKLLEERVSRVLPLSNYSRA